MAAEHALRADAPVIRNADEKSVATINRDMRTLAERASESQTGRYTRAAPAHGVEFGMFGVTSLYLIVSPPVTCIIGGRRGRAAGGARSRWPWG